MVSAALAVAKFCATDALLRFIHLFCSGIGCIKQVLRQLDLLNAEVDKELDAVRDLARVLY